VCTPHELAHTHARALNGWVHPTRRRRYISDANREVVSPRLQPLTADQAEDCDSRCRRANLVCDSSQFPFINDCDALKRLFPCEGGCHYEVGAGCGWWRLAGVRCVIYAACLQVGPDIPNYVPDRANKMYRKCLVTDRAALPSSTALHCAGIQPHALSRTHHPCLLGPRAQALPDRPRSARPCPVSSHDAEALHKFRQTIVRPFYFGSAIGRHGIRHSTLHVNVA
jgi:hypothetical protein